MRAAKTKYQPLSWIFLNEYASLHLNRLDKDISNADHVSLSAFLQMIDLQDILFRQFELELRQVSINDEWEKV